MPRQRFVRSMLSFVLSVTPCWLVSSMDAGGAEGEGTGEAGVEVAEAAREDELGLGASPRERGEALERRGRRLLRYDTFKPFQEPSAWDYDDLTTHAHPKAEGFQSSAVKSPHGDGAS